MELMHIFITAFNAIAPMCLLIALGAFLRYTGFLDEDFSLKANKLVFNLLLPAMLFNNVYKVNSISDISWDIVIFTVLSTFVVFLIGMIFAPMISKDAKRRGVVLQGFFRSNTSVIGVTLSELLGGTAAAGVASILAAFAIPLLNTFAVIALSLYVDESGKRPTVKSMIKKIITNPLIIAIASALLILLLRAWEVKSFGSEVFTLKNNLKFLYSPIASLAQSASPIAMLILGTEFSLSDVGDMKKEIVWTTLWRLIIVPVLVLSTAVLLSVKTSLCNFGPEDYPALIAMFATPCAVTSVVMAQQMGSDGPLAAQLVVWTSLLSMFTLFAIVCVLMFFGLLYI